MVAKKIIIPQVRVGVFRIPTKEHYRKTHPPDYKDIPWQKVYGDRRCSKCHQHFKEGEAYEADPKFCSGKIHKFQHIECPK